MATASPASGFSWNVDMEVNLFHAMRGHKPAGVNRHFQMISIHDKLSSASKKITSDDVWKHLSKLYDLQALHESEIVPFPNKSGDFSLPSASTGSLPEQSFPRSTYIKSSQTDTVKAETPAKSSPKPSGKPDSSSSSKTPNPSPATSTKSESSKADAKSDHKSGKSHHRSGSSSSSSAHKSSNSSSTPKISSSNSTSTPKSGSSGAGAQSNPTPDPSPKRTKRTRNVPSATASPATPTEPAAKRRR